MYTKNMVAKIVTALTQRVAKLNRVQVSQLSIQMFPFFCLWVIHNLYVFTSIQLTANGQSSPVVVRPVVKESKQERLMYTQNMVAKIVMATTKIVAMTESAQVSQFSIQLFDYLWGLLSTGRVQFDLLCRSVIWT